MRIPYAGSDASVGPEEFGRRYAARVLSGQVSRADLPEVSTVDVPEILAPYVARRLAAIYCPGGGWRARGTYGRRMKPWEAPIPDGYARVSAYRATSAAEDDAEDYEEHHGVRDRAYRAAGY